MYIPAAHPVASIFKSEDDNSSVASWSSLIGIITAICGNILISFALNTQRYAHMRLGDDRDRDEEKSKAHKEGSKSKSRSYGTNQENAAEERARLNAESQPDENIEAGIENGEAERDPLIPKVDSRKSSSTTTSDTYVDNEQDEDKPSKSYLKSPIWWLGISMMVVGEAGNFLAYGFAPASIVSPLGVVALISNCLIAPLLLHEQFRWRDGLGVIIAVAGCVTVVLSASGSNPRLDPDDIWKLITQWEFETYLGVTAFLIVVLMVASNKFGERSVLIDLGLVGLFGGYTALSTKGVASLLSNTIWRAFTFPITYLLIVILVATAVLQIKYVNRALQRFNSTIVIPTQFVLFTISVIVGSAVLYRDFERRSAADAGKFVGGCALTFLGVWCITSGRSDENTDDDEQGDENSVHMEDHEVDHTSAGQKPSVHRSQTAEEVAILITPDLESTTDVFAKTFAAAQVPAVKSAVHQPTAGTIPTSSESSKPPMHATTSEPSLPTVNAPDHLTPQTPSRRRPSGGRTSPALTPQNNDTLPPPPRLLGRHSITDLLPGPLMSPLSSSLSAIVADSLRRGVDHTPSSLRARTLRLARRKTGESMKGGYDVTARRRSIDSADLSPRASNSRADQHLAEPSSSGRGRSFSATITDIFSPSKKNKSGDAESSR